MQVDRTVVHTENLSSAFLMDGFFVQNANANANITGYSLSPNSSGGGMFNESLFGDSTSATGLPNDNNYLQTFLRYTHDNLEQTTFQQSIIENVEMGENTASFEGLVAGDYLVCSYNENQNCLPNPSPSSSNLNNIYDTGSIQDGCFAIV